MYECLWKGASAPETRVSDSPRSGTCELPDVDTRSKLKSSARVVHTLNN